MKRNLGKKNGEQGKRAVVREEEEEKGDKRGMMGVG